jgi:hypothetical protein
MKARDPSGDTCLRSSSVSWLRGWMTRVNSTTSFTLGPGRSAARTAAVQPSHTPRVHSNTPRPRVDTGADIFDREVVMDQAPRRFMEWRS